MVTSTIWPDPQSSSPGCIRYGPSIQWHRDWSNLRPVCAASGEGMKHYTQMVQEPEFAAREQGYTFVSHQQEVGAGYFDDVTTVIQGGSSSVKALTGSTEAEQFH